jgi:xylitol oxidase
MTARATNWAGNISYQARSIQRPESVAELQKLVASSDRVRALGTGHSFNRIADTPGDLISLAGLPPVVEIDSERSVVTVSAGLRYGEIAIPLQRAGFALHNLGSLPHISVGGACAAGTHGSGDHNGNLSSAVAAIEIVGPGGELTHVSRQSDADRLRGSVIGLGSLGIVTALTLDIQPTFQLSQHVYDGLPIEALAGSFDEVFGAGYSVSVFTDWRAPFTGQIWLKRRIDPTEVPDEPARQWLGATLADTPRHPVPGMPPENSTQQLGIPGAWHERLPHFRLEFTPSSGEELQTEYLIDRRDVVEALTVLESLGEEMAQVLQISEIRTIAADELWMSPSYRRESVALHFTWIDDTAAVLPVLGAIEARLAPLAPRPHWGKVFTITPEVVAASYERRPDLLRLLEECDPTGKFRNDMIDRFFPVAG